MQISGWKFEEMQSIRRCFLIFLSHWFLHRNHRKATRCIHMMLAKQHGTYTCCSIKQHTAKYHGTDTWYPPKQNSAKHSGMYTECPLNHIHHRWVNGTYTSTSKLLDEKAAPKYITRFQSESHPFGIFRHPQSATARLRTRLECSCPWVIQIIHRLKKQLSLSDIAIYT